MRKFSAYYLHYTHAATLYPGVARDSDSPYATAYVSISAYGAAEVYGVPGSWGGAGDASGVGDGSGSQPRNSSISTHTVSGLLLRDLGSLRMWSPTTR